MSATKLPAANSAPRPNILSTLKAPPFPTQNAFYHWHTPRRARAERDPGLADAVGGSKEQPQYEENEANPAYDTSGPYGNPRLPFRAARAGKTTPAMDRCARRYRRTYRAQFRITLKRGWQMMASTSYVLAAY
ncbi:hypothetical protein ACLK1T_10420 [Escherichia coli]